jgi:Mg2+-importing ATPase
MAYMGPVSSIFDLLCFAILWWVIGANSPESAPLFQCGWFLFGTVSQVLVIHMIRTAKIPFIQSLASRPLLISTILVTLIALVVSFTDFATGLDMQKLPLSFLPWLAALLAGYFILVQIIKKFYIRRYGDWM